MKQKNHILSILAALVLMIGLSSCQPDWGPGSYYPSSDPNLSGTWILVQLNSHNVPLDDANWFWFSGGNTGYYYYYDQWGRPATEAIRYTNQYVSGSNRNVLYIDYAGGGSMEGTYWFSPDPNTLWIQWVDDRGYVQTYVYDRVRNAPW